MTLATSGSPAHDRLIAETEDALVRLPTRDADVARLLRVSLVALRRAAWGASLTRDPDEARFLWTYCAESESALQAALRELWRRRRISRAEYERLQVTATAARRHRNLAFLEAQRVLVTAACN